MVRCAGRMENHDMAMAYQGGAVLRLCGQWILGSLSHPRFEAAHMDCKTIRNVQELRS